MDTGNLAQWASAGAILIGTIVPFVYLKVQSSDAKKGKLILESLSKKQFSIVNKASKILKRKKQKKEKVENKKTFVINFKGDVMANQVAELRNIINYLLPIVEKEDEVVINLESPGGAVSGYSLASNQLERIKNAGLKLTVCIDKVAASGGYMMAVVGDEIVAAPNAVVGSIGVVAEFPNFNEALSKLGINWKQYTAGKYKRTVGTFSPITEEGEEHFRKNLDVVHDIFKNHIQKHRDVDLEKVATGEYWLAVDSKEKELNLVDRLALSDEVIAEKMMHSEVIEVKYKQPAKNAWEAFTNASVDAVIKLITKAISLKNQY